LQPIISNIATDIAILKNFTDLIVARHRCKAS
jgi:hypothetical protein